MKEINSNLWDKVLNKVVVIQPNFPIRVSHHKSYEKQQKLQLVFVGNHVARKGGIVALRLAEKAEKLELPLIIHIVSGL